MRQPEKYALMPIDVRKACVAVSLVPIGSNFLRKLIPSEVLKIEAEPLFAICIDVNSGEKVSFCGGQWNFPSMSEGFKSHPLMMSLVFLGQFAVNMEESILSRLIRKSTCGRKREAAMDCTSSPIFSVS